jgi:hypothetical protein
VLHGAKVGTFQKQWETESVVSLVIGDHTAVACDGDGGLLVAEYALFDASDVELRATSPGAVREAGYATSAALALERLFLLGVSDTLVDECARITRTSLAARYARGTTVARAVETLGAAELFEGRTYVLASGTYEGTWIDLPSLAADLGLPSASVALQLVGLCAALLDVAKDTPLRLSTARVALEKPVGWRSHRRVDAPVRDLPRALQDLARAPAKRVGGFDDGPSRIELLAAMRARERRVDDRAKARIRAIERAAVPSRPAPREGPLSDPVAWAIEEQISRGAIEDAEARIAELEKRSGVSPSVVYLRSRAALLGGREQPHVVAQRVSGLVATQPFAELELLAAQAWAAAGNMGRAVPYARLLAMDPTADGVLRAQAREIVEAARRGEPSLPPSLPPRDAFPSEPPTPPRSSAGRAVLSEPPPPTSRRPTTKPAPPVDEASAMRHGTWPRNLLRGAALLSDATDLLAEHLPDPRPDELGAHADARCRCTQMVRQLAEDYRKERGVTLTLDATGLELVQLGLRERHGAAMRAEGAPEDVQRHGAFLAELLVRRARGEWLATEDEQPSDWRMQVGDATVQPFGRVLRFLALGARERDLVAFYFGLLLRLHRIEA